MAVQQSQAAIFIYISLPLFLYIFHCCGLFLPAQLHLQVNRLKVLGMDSSFAPTMRCPGCLVTWLDRYKQMVLEVKSGGVCLLLDHQTTARWAGRRQSDSILIFQQSNYIRIVDAMLPSFTALPTLLATMILEIEASPLCPDPPRPLGECMVKHLGCFMWCAPYQFVTSSSPQCSHSHWPHGQADPECTDHEV